MPNTTVTINEANPNSNLNNTNSPYDNIYSDITIIADRVVGLILEHVYIEVSSHEEDLFESGLLDSFDLVELLHQLEEEFAVPIPIQEIDFDNFRTVSQIAMFLVQLKKV